MLITILATFYFIRLKLALCGKFLKTKQNSGFSSSPEVPYNEKSTHERVVSAWFSSSGTQDVSVARRAPSNPLCPVALYPRKPGGETLCCFVLRNRQAMVASRLACPLPFPSYESKLSRPATPRSSPLRVAWRSIYTKKTQRFAVLSCSGTQDWTADLMIMNPFRW